MKTTAVFFAVPPSSRCGGTTARQVPKLKRGLWLSSPLITTTAVFFAVMTLLAHATDSATPERLDVCRQKIDSLDQRIVELIQQRAQVVEEIGSIKREAHLPIAAPAREKQVIEKVQELAKGGPLPADAVGRIYEKLVTEMRLWEAGLNGETLTTPTTKK
jgi:chorismate mutase